MKSQNNGLGRNCILFELFFVRVCDIHCGPKSNKLKLLGKLEVQHGIGALFGGRSCV